ncbi:MAG TPA: DUF3761 domain-containing protein [Pseudonocardiaceae bacterium]|nr:DUF3761 domain-containing protein [Pseudonocardiaceae bacterium]
MSGALFASGASIAACENATTAQPSGPQLSTEIPSNFATPAPPPITKTLVATPPPAPPVALVAPKPEPAVTAPAPAPAAPAPQSLSCAGDYYRNSDGNCVHRPEQAIAAPSGATAQCEDGSYSFSQHRQGTCSHHGGVARWL